MAPTPMSIGRARALNRIIEAFYPSDRTRWSLDYLGPVDDGAADSFVRIDGATPIRITQDRDAGPDLRQQSLIVVNSLGAQSVIDVEDALDALEQGRLALRPHCENPVRQSHGDVDRREALP